MQYTNKCHCCGHIETAYIKNLNIPLIMALQKFYLEYEETGEVVNITDNKERGLTFSQKTNFYTLQQFGLIFRIEGKPGYLPTPLCKLFLYGKASVFSCVAVMGKEVLPINHEVWNNKKEKPWLKYIYDFIEREDWCFKQRSEFSFEKSLQSSLF